MKREYMLDDVIAAISTPIGTGGIGIVRMSGAGCIALADSIFIGKKKLTEKATHTLSYGKITDGAGGEIIDEVLVSVMKAPHTYTKEDIVEINCHGGSLVTRRVLEAVLKTGARIAQPGEFTKRSFLNGRIDLTQAEAVIDLIESKTELSRQAAVNQLEGRLKTAVREMREEILDMIASIEAVIDYPDYDVEEETYGTMEQGVKKLLARMEKLLEGADRGKIIREGLQTVIVGKTDVVNLRFTVPYADEVYALRVFVPQESIYVGFEGAAYETLLSGCKVHDEQAVEVCLVAVAFHALPGYVLAVG